jgi:hypothetical protein
MYNYYNHHNCYNKSEDLCNQLFKRLQSLQPLIERNHAKTMCVLKPVNGVVLAYIRHYMDQRIRIDFRHSIDYNSIEFNLPKIKLNRKAKIGKRQEYMRYHFSVTDMCQIESVALFLVEVSYHISLRLK